MNVEKLSKTEMLNYAQSILYPIEGEYSEEQIDQRQFTFCLNCPDPVGALYMLFDAPQGVDVSTLVNSALTMPARAVSSWCEDSLAFDHPLRLGTLN